MNRKESEYQVSDLPEYPQRLTITGESVRYESHSNVSRPGSIGIGVYQRPLGSWGIRGDLVRNSIRNRLQSLAGP